MSLWFFIWFILSAIILGAMGWSTAILIQQKNAWKDYAAKKGLTFTPNKFFEPPEMEGIIDGYNVSFFTAVQQKEDTRKNRQVTVMQVISHQKFVDGIGAGTKEVVPFLKALEAITPHDIKSSTWKKEYEIRSRNKKSVDAYLTEDRIKIFNSILGMSGANVLILMDENEGVFRFETSNPLHSSLKIDTIMTKLLARIDKLKPRTEEAQSLKALEDSKPTPPPVQQQEKADETEAVEATESKEEE